MTYVYSSPGMKTNQVNKQLNTNLTETGKTQKRKASKKKTIGLYCGLGIPLIAIGIVGGVILGKNVFYVDPYANVNMDALNDDYSDVYKKYQKSSSSNYYEKFNNVELANIALLNLNHVDNFYSITTGSVLAAGVKQEINATYIKHYEDYYEETITASRFVRGANRFYMYGNNTDWYKGKYVNSKTGDYSKAKVTSYTNEEFEESWGRQLSRACIYIINENTCLSSSITTDSNGNHVIELDLDPKTSVVRYIKQMVNTGGLSQKPVFHSVKLQFVVDEDVKLLTFHTDEVYDVHMVIDAKDSKGTITQNFTYGERAIPSIEESSIYE